MSDRIFVYGEGVLQEHPINKRNEVNAFVELENRNQPDRLKVYVGERFPPPGRKLEDGVLRELTERERWQIGELDLESKFTFDSAGGIVPKTPAELAADGIISVDELRALMVRAVNEKFESAHQPIKDFYPEMNRQGWLRKAEQARLLLSHPVEDRAAMLVTIPFLVGEANVRFAAIADEVERASSLAAIVLEKETLFEAFNAHCNGVLSLAIASIYSAETVSAIAAVPSETEFPNFYTYGE